MGAAVAATVDGDVNVPAREKAMVAVVPPTIIRLVAEELLA
jgi:hypothetical protein